MQTIDTTAACEDSSGDDERGGGTGVLVADRGPEQAAVHDGCPNCGAGAYSGSSWCRSCGFYALLGRCIELADWEKEVAAGDYDGPKEAPTATWMLVPIWAWQLSAALLGVGGISVAGRYLTLPDTAQRDTWAVCQVLAGMTVFLVAHIRVAKAALSHDKSLTLSDATMHPGRVWITACLDFGKLSRWVALGAAGVWATILAHVLLGVPYNSLFTHEEAPAKKEEKGGAAAAVGAKSSGKQMTMEEAMDEFSEKAGAKQAADGDADKKGAKGKLPTAAKDKDKQEKAPEIKQLDCLIVGYKPDPTGDSKVSLVVAVRTDGQWKVVGTVSQGLTPEIQAELAEAAKSLRRERPFVECTETAIWLEPVLRCEVEAEVPPGETNPTNMTLKGLK